MLVLMDAVAVMQIGRMQDVLRMWEHVLRVQERHQQEQYRQDVQMEDGSSLAPSLVLWSLKAKF